MSLKARLRQNSVGAFALDVQERQREVRAGLLVNSIALRAFLSLLPLLLIGIAALGFLAQGRLPGGDWLLRQLDLDPSADLAEQVIANAQLQGEAAKQFDEILANAQRNGSGSGIVGLSTLLLTGIGVVRAIASTLNAVWQVPDRGMSGYLRALLWLLGFVVFAGVLAGASTVAAIVPAPGGRILGFLVGVAGAAGVFWWTQWVLANISVPWVRLWPGAVVGGVGFAIFQVLGTIYIPRVIASAGALYGPVAVVIVLITVFTLFAQMLVYSTIVNVVAWERRHGTVSLSISAPAFPRGSLWVRAERGGGRAKRSSPHFGPSRWQRLTLRGHRAR